MDDLRRRLSDVLRGFPVAAAWLFGSRARGDCGPASDFDVAVLPASAVTASERLSLTLDLVSALTRVLETDRVDVVLADEASPLLAHRILRDGLLVLSADDVRRVRFEVHALREYFDTRPLDEEYFRHLTSRHSGGRALG